MSQWLFLNDDFVLSQDASISFRDLSIQRGYGIFDFFRISGGVGVFLEDHLDRFLNSAEKMHLPVGKTRDALRRIIDDLIHKNNIIDSGIRITLTGGNSPDGYSIATPNLILAQQHFQPCSAEQFKKGIKLMSHNHERQLPEVKTIDYLMAIHLQPELRKRQADDIIYHDEGSITECPRANIFMVTGNNKIITPSEKILKGVTRKKVLELAKQDFEVEERSITLDELKSASEVFITSSTKQILPVRQIDDVVYPKENQVAGILYGRLNTLIATSQENKLQTTS
jgi:branched-chain amino acid aminotransferase